MRNTANTGTAEYTQQNLDFRINTLEGKENQCYICKYENISLKDLLYHMVTIVIYSHIVTYSHSYIYFKIAKRVS